MGRAMREVWNSGYEIPWPKAADGPGNEFVKNLKWRPRMSILRRSTTQRHHLLMTDLNIGRHAGRGQWRFAEENLGLRNGAWDRSPPFFSSICAGLYCQLGVQVSSCSRYTSRERDNRAARTVCFVWSNWWVSTDHFLQHNNDWKVLLSLAFVRTCVRWTGVKPSERFYSISSFRYRILDDYPAEEFTKVYWIKFQKIQSAR